jgi:hypothetical protein
MHHKIVKHESEEAQRHNKNNTLQFKHVASIDRRLKM